MTSSEYKKLIEGFLGGLLLASSSGGKEKISNMLPSKKKSDFTHSLNFTYSNSGSFAPNSVSKWLDFGKVKSGNPTQSMADDGSGLNLNSATPNGSGNLPTSEITVSNMVNSSGGTTPTNADTKWVFVANPNCCEKCLALNGHTEISQTEPKFYGHVHDREGRYNCRCHWVRLK